MVLIKVYRGTLASEWKNQWNPQRHSTERQRRVLLCGEQGRPCLCWFVLSLCESFIDLSSPLVAINQVQDNLGFDLQTSLVGLGHIVGWLFAVKTNGAPNGFTLTGGQFNRSVNIMFPQSGQQAVINEQYFGLDPFNFLNFKADIHGALPTIPSDAPVTMDDFTLEFTRVQPGTLKARLEHSFTFGENSVPMPVVIDETITFDECPHRTVDPEQSTTRLKIERNHIQYDVEHQTTRYAFYDSKIAPLSGLLTLFTSRIDESLLV